MENMIVGVAASAGIYRGPVRVVLDESGFAAFEPGEVLVCAVLPPSWTVLLGRAGAIVTDRGAITSNPAILAREFGLPAVVGTVDGTSALRDGQVVTVDGDEGVVRNVADATTVGPGDRQVRDREIRCHSPKAPSSTPYAPAAQSSRRST